MVLLVQISIKAQNNGITGSHLDIGTGNTLIENDAHLWGNAIGVNNSVRSANTLAVGNCDTIMENSVNATALGGMNRVQGIASMAFGNTIKISGNFSYGLGRYLKPNANCSMVLGYGIAGSGINPNVFLENNYTDCLMIGLHSTKPTLTVGPSPNDYPNGDRFDLTGKVAIGDVPVPDIAAKLHIRSDQDEDAGIFLEPKDMTTGSAFLRLRDDEHSLSVDNEGVMRLRSMDGINRLPLLVNGRVGINVYSPNDMASSYSLCVNGGIMATKVTIKNYGNWHDYVFDPAYALMPLSELKEFVATRHHLPDIPSEEDVIANGIDVDVMQGLLLKKIEELTLYTIQLQEQVDSMQKELDQLKRNVP